MGNIFGPGTKFSRLMMSLSYELKCIKSIS